jgi:hypothetical protein
MKMNCLKGFQELIGCMKEARPIFDGECTEVFETYSPDSFHLRVFHEGFGHVAQGRGGGVLRGELGYARTPVHLNAEIQHGQNDRNRANQLRDRVNRFPVHPCVIPQATGWLLLRFVSDFENDFAARYC